MSRALKHVFSSMRKSNQFFKHFNHRRWIFQRKGNFGVNVAQRWFRSWHVRNAAKKRPTLRKCKSNAALWVLCERGEGGTRASARQCCAGIKTVAIRHDAIFDGRHFDVRSRAQSEGSIFCIPLKTSESHARHRCLYLYWPFSEENANKRPCDRGFYTVFPHVDFRD